MSSTLHKFSQSACALAVALMLAACGGGTAEPPPETVPPTLTITDSESGDTATGPVTFTFTFSEDIGTSFVAEDVLVIGGTAGTLTKVSATVYTMVVTPTPGASGTMTVSVAAGKYADIALNQNTASASASQAYGSGSTSTAFLSWDEAEGSSPLTGAILQFGDGGIAVETAPGGASGLALKLSRSGAQNFGGLFFDLATPVPFTNTNKTVTARVYASRAGAKVYLKVEGTGAAVEAEATVTAANTWQTVTWNMAGVDAAASYTRMVFSADTDVAIGGAQSYWFDDITVTETAGGGGGGGGGGASVTSISWDEPEGSGPLTGAILQFGDGGIAVETAPGGASGLALKLSRSGAQNFGGLFFDVAPAIGFTSTNKTVTALVYASRAGAKVYLKVEGTGAAVEAEATVTAANTWQTVTWNMAGVDAAASYTRMVFSADTDVAIGGAQSYWFDDITVTAGSGGGGGGGGASSLPVTFDDSAVTYTLRGFEGAGATLVADPEGGGNTVVEVVKGAGAPWYAGVVVSTGANESIATIPFTDSAKTMKLRVYSPGPGMLVRLKVENAGDPTITCETDATTVGTGWETLTFNFANPGNAPPGGPNPTATLNVAQTYNKAVVFMNVAPAAVGVAGTFYFDDLAFGTP